MGWHFDDPVTRTRLPRPPPRPRPVGETGERRADRVGAPMTTKPPPGTVTVDWARSATYDHRCTFVAGEAKRHRAVVAILTKGDTGLACRYVGRLDDSQEPASTTADNGTDRLLEASRPWTTATSGVLDVGQLIGSPAWVLEIVSPAGHHCTCTIAASPPLQNAPDARVSVNLSRVHREGT